MKTADIHSAFSQDSADAPDDSRHVPVAQHEHVTLRRSLNMKAVDLSNAAFAPLSAVTEDGPCQTVLGLVRNDLCSDGRRGITASSNVSRCDSYASFFRD